MSASAKLLAVLVELSGIRKRVTVCARVTLVSMDSTSTWSSANASACPSTAVQTFLITKRAAASALLKTAQASSRTTTKLTGMRPTAAASACLTSANRASTGTNTSAAACASPSSAKTIFTGAPTCADAAAYLRSALTALSGTRSFVRVSVCQLSARPVCIGTTQGAAVNAFLKPVKTS